ncbi:type II secretion system (T2SS) protein F [Brevibacterium sanguinis]|uniref:Type II secretion system (T2SS) protein F n=2 Tax=Brevibacterium TaxID=1696 RepID=A0A366IHT5_9MICO|nr:MULTISPECIES: type II secretion system F family protein [Brevibacterium]RBP63391.1 type II secretion system (T2SS) protein F [Brevibacterium sanguinis]RBP69858.1 type II secretion system (T2SS) protein F [Brevibacterium celere]
MLPLIVGAFVAAAILLWSDSSAGRLAGLLRQSTTELGQGPATSRTATARTAVPRMPKGSEVTDEQLAFDLDLVSICLTSGLPIPVALTLAAEATGDRSGLERMARARSIGEPERAHDDRLLPLLEVVEFSERTGVGPAPLIESVAQELRDSSRRRRQEAAAALGVRLVVPLGLCILPAFLLLSVVPVVISLLGDLTSVFF